MTDAPPELHQLVFTGEHLPDISPEQARRALADFFGVDDPQGVAGFFSGKPVTLRRNLQKTDAMRLYRQLRSTGLICEVQVVAAPAQEPPPATETRTEADKAGTAPAKKAPPKKAPTRKASARTAPSNKAPVKKAPATEMSPPQTRAKKAPAKKAPATDAPQRSSSTRKPAVSKPAAQESPTLRDTTPTAPADAQGELQLQPQAPSSKGQSKRKPRPKREPDSQTTRRRPAAAGRSTPQSPTQPPRARASKLSGRPGAATAPTAGARTSTPPTSAPTAAPAPEQPARDKSLGPAGATPNYFALRPALERIDYPRIRARARSRALIGLVVVFAIAVISGGLLLRFPAAGGEAPAGAEAAGAARGQLLLLADNALHLHGRSGRGIESIEADALGLAAIAAPLWMRDDGSVFLTGKAAPAAPPALWRCDLAAKTCTPAVDAAVAAIPAAVTGSTIADTLFLHTRGGELLRIAGDGRLEARSDLALPPGHPRLLHDGGLLRVPAAEGPLVGVYRPDTAGFATQLDALLLLAPTAQEREQEQVRDVVRVGDSYWALLGNGRGDRGLYRFDNRWTHVGDAALPDGFSPDFLVAWQDKLLVADRSQTRLLRFATDGRAEASLDSELLGARVAAWQDTHRLGQRTRTLAVGIAAALAFAVLTFAVLQYLYAAHLPAGRGSGTALLDPMPGGIHWLPQARQREAQLLRLSALLAGVPLLAASALLLGSGMQTTVLLAPALLGSLLAMRLLWRGRGGYCGLLPERLIVVDYDGRYSYGPRSDRRSDSRFLLLGGVAVPLGLRWLSNLQAQPLLQPGGALQGADVLPPMEMLARLMHLRHPWLLALLSVLVGWSLSALLLLALLALR